MGSLASTAVERADLVVVGAGPAGAAAALGALRARPGARVVLLDRAVFPRDKACGDGIAPQALDELAAMGVTGVADGWPEVPLLSLRPPSTAIEDAVVGRAPRPSRVVPRAVFDALLVAAAQQAGADLRRHRVRSVREVGGLVEVDDRFAAPVVVAADGAGSVVRRVVGVARNHDRHLAIAIRGYAPEADHDASVDRTVVPDRGGKRHPADRGRGLARGPDLTGGHRLRIDLVAEGWPAYAWVFPLGDGRVNVGYGMRRSGAGGVPGGAGLAERLASALPEYAVDPATLATHHLPLSSGRPRAAVGRVLLAGDAASLINPSHWRGDLLRDRVGPPRGCGGGRCTGRRGPALPTAPGAPPRTPPAPHPRTGGPDHLAAAHPQRVGGHPRPGGLRRGERARPRRRARLGRDRGPHTRAARPPDHGQTLNDRCSRLVPGFPRHAAVFLERATARGAAHPVGWNRAGGPGGRAAGREEGRPRDGGQTATGSSARLSVEAGAHAASGW